jgi:hypothetical protein
MAQSIAIENVPFQTPLTATGIKDPGKVAGSRGDFNTQAFLDNGGVCHNLGMLPGEMCRMAFALDSSGRFLYLRSPGSVPGSGLGIVNGQKPTLGSERWFRYALCAQEDAGAEMTGAESSTKKPAPCLLADGCAIGRPSRPDRLILIDHPNG